MLALLLTLAPGAVASSETELPPALRADVSVGYEAEVEWAGLEEDTADGVTEVGRRQDVRHDIALRAAFAPIDGFALTFGLDGLARRRVGFPSGQRMLLDPVAGKGTSVPGGSLDEDALPEAIGGGLNGIWLGMAFQPFAERFAKQHAVTWRLDLAVRTAPAGSFFEVGEDGRRGPGVGGPTFRARAAFSREHERSSPYMVATWSLQTRRPASIPDGQGGIAEVQVDPGQRLDVIGGVEIRLNDDPDELVTVDFDLSTGFGYRSPARVASGVFLPDVLGQTRGTAVTRGERLRWHVGAGFDIDVGAPVLIQLWSRAFWALPWRVEGPYPVRTTLDTTRAAFGMALTGRIR